MPIDKPITNRPETGVLFRVRDKRSENSPDFKGGINIAGAEWELSCWEKTSKRGVPYLSLSVRLPREQADTPARTNAAALDDSISYEKPADGRF